MSDFINNGTKTDFMHIFKFHLTVIIANTLRNYTAHIQCFLRFNTYGQNNN